MGSDVALGDAHRRIHVEHLARQERLGVTPSVSAQERVDRIKRLLGWESVVESIGRSHGIGVKDIFGRSSLPNIVAARQEAVEAIYVLSDMSLSAIGRLVGRDRSSILYTLKKRGVRLRHSPRSKRRDDA